MFQKFAGRIIEALGLVPQAAWLRARGIIPWSPLIPENEFTDCVENAVQTLLELEPADNWGEYLEFGVCRGTSTVCVHQVLVNKGLEHIRLIGFDSFEGLPPEAEGEGWAPGSFHSTIGTTRRNLKKNGVNMEKVELVKGWYKDTLNQETIDRLNIKKASIMMIDCDIYTASKEALTFCGPLIDENAVIIFDDWGWMEEVGKTGQKEAFDEFLKAFPHLEAEPLPNYIPQSRVFLIKKK